MAPPFCAWWHHRVVLDPGNGSLSWCQGCVDVLDSLHKSILWTVQMSVLHDICRAWFRDTEGRAWSVHLKCIQTVSIYCGSVWKATLSSAWPATTESGHLSQRDCGWGCSCGNKQLVTPTVFMFTLSDFTGSSQGPLFGLSLLCFLNPHTVSNSHVLSLTSLYFGVWKSSHINTQMRSSLSCCLSLF